MVILFLVGTIPAVILSGVFLSAYTEQSLTRLGNDVNNQCQILATQLGSANYLDDPGNETLAGELTQLATLYDGRILIIDRNFRSWWIHMRWKKGAPCWQRKSSNALRAKVRVIM